MRKKILSLLLILASLAALAVPVLAVGAPAAGSARAYGLSVAAATSTDATPGPASSTDIPENGLYKAPGGKLYYYKNGKLQKGGWFDGVDGKRYFAGGDGALYTGFCTVGSKSYYFSVNDGHMMRSGVVTGPNNRKYYVAKDGHALKGGPITGPKGARYVAAPDGHLLKNGFTTYKDQRYYVDKNCLMVCSQWVQVSGKWYYLQADGTMARNKYIDGHYVDAGGVRRS